MRLPLAYKAVQYWALTFLLQILLVVQMVYPPSVQASSHFLKPAEAFKLVAGERDPASGEVLLRWNIAPGYYLYRDRIEIKTLSGETVKPINMPSGKMKDDLTFGVTEVYYDSLEIVVRAPNTQNLMVSWQGCADAGLCYPPQSEQLTLDAPLTASLSENEAEKDKTAHPSLLSANKANDSQISKLLDQYSLAWTIPAFFLFGLALTFTPCVLPMIPIVSSIVIGAQVHPRRAFALTLAFIVPMALTYALLGAVAAMVGAQFQAILQNV